LTGDISLLVFEYIYSYEVGKPEGKRALRRLRRRWEDKIKKNIQEMGWGDGLERSGSG
jgi:hypothetical protein